MDAAGAKIEVWRKAVGGRCLAEIHRDIQAIVTDDAVDVQVPLWPRHDISRLAQNLLDLADMP